MLSKVGSPVTAQNERLKRRTRTGAETDSNVLWLRRQAKELSAESGAANLDDGTFILLVGGIDRSAFRLRLAQAHVRNDLWPSHWSHAALLAPTGTAEPDDDSLVYEVSLQPTTGFRTTVSTNGMELIEPPQGVEDTSVPELKTRSRLGQYRSPQLYPNIALLRVDIPVASWASRGSIAVTGSTQTRGSVDNPGCGADETIFSVVESFARQRGMLDLPELILVWLAFLWGVGRTMNPLFEGHGIPSAVMVDSVLAAVGYDISPGSDSRVTCPETIWQTAKWWHLYYQDDPEFRPLAGHYDIASKINEHLLASPQVDRAHN